MTVVCSVDGSGLAAVGASEEAQPPSAEEEAANTHVNTSAQNGDLTERELCKARAWQGQLLALLGRGDYGALPHIRRLAASAAADDGQAWLLALTSPDPGRSDGATALHVAARYLCAALCELLPSADIHPDTDLESSYFTTAQGLRSAPTAPSIPSPQPSYVPPDAPGAASPAARTSTLPLPLPHAPGALHQPYFPGCWTCANVRDARGRTPLHEAACANSVLGVAALLGAGAALEADDEVGRTALHEAVERGAEDVIEPLIRQGACATARDEQLRTPLHLACLFGSSRTVGLLARAAARSSGPERTLTAAPGALPPPPPPRRDPRPAPGPPAGSFPAAAGVLHLDGADPIWAVEADRAARKPRACSTYSMPPAGIATAAHAASPVPAATSPASAPASESQPPAAHGPPKSVDTRNPGPADNIPGPPTSAAATPAAAPAAAGLNRDLDLDLDLHCAGGWIPAHVAAAAGHSGALLALAEAGHRVNDGSSNPAFLGWTPLHVAVATGAAPAVEMLLGRLKADPDAAAAGGLTPRQMLNDLPYWRRLWLDQGGGGLEDGDDEAAELPGDGRVRELFRPPPWGFWVDPEHLKWGKALDGGAFGEVFRGTFQGEQVAIKSLQTLSSTPVETFRDHGTVVVNQQQQDALLQEIAIMKSLRPHERVATFIGTTTGRDGAICLVMDWYPHTLQHFLSDRPPRPLDARARFRIALQIAQGLRFLHGNKVVHRDLKPDNVLLTHNREVKLADFGLSRVLRAGEGGSRFIGSIGFGHPYWTAPEVMQGKPYNEKADVYSWGVIMYQLATWEHRLEGPLGHSVLFQCQHMAGSQIAAPRLTSHLPSSGLSAPVRSLLLACLDDDPLRRPTMDAVVGALTELPQTQRQLHQPAPPPAEPPEADEARDGTQPRHGRCLRKQSSMPLRGVLVRQVSGHRVMVRAPSWGHRTRANGGAGRAGGGGVGGAAAAGGGGGAVLRRFVGGEQAPRAGSPLRPQPPPPPPPPPAAPLRMPVPPSPFMMSDMQPSGPCGPVPLPTIQQAQAQQAQVQHDDLPPTALAILPAAAMSPPPQQGPGVGPPADTTHPTGAAGKQALGPGPGPGPGPGLGPPLNTPPQPPQPPVIAAAGPAGAADAVGSAAGGGGSCASLGPPQPAPLRSPFAALGTALPGLGSLLAAMPPIQLPGPELEADGVHR